MHKRQSYTSAILSLLLTDAKELLTPWWRSLLAAIVPVAFIACITATQLETPSWREFILLKVVPPILSAFVLPCILFTVSWATAPRRLYNAIASDNDQLRRENQRLTLESERPIQQVAAPVAPPAIELPGMRIVEKSRAVDGGYGLIRELINNAPPPSPLDREAVAEWREDCIITLRELLSDEHEETWMKIHAALYGVEDASIDSAKDVRRNIRKAVRQLKALLVRFNHTMIRRVARLTGGEYNRLYPIDEPPQRDTDIGDEGE